MVHHTIHTKMPPATRASSTISPMLRFLVRWSWVLIVGGLVACSSPSRRMSEVRTESPAPSATSSADTPRMARSRWIPASWSDLPGWGEDNLTQAWPALLRSCERALSTWVAVCADLRQLSQASLQEQQLGLVRLLRPYRIEAATDADPGLLTAYYEPVLVASRLKRPGFEVPVYAPPSELPRSPQPWYSRREIDTLAQAQAALRGHELAYLSDPVDAMVMHIQGSARLQIQEPDGRWRQVRLAYAATNQHPYQSIGRWLLDRRLTSDASWPGIKKWLAANPQRRDELLWANPRYVFFREVAMLDPAQGPTGAQGLPLTPGRSIAIDPESMPYGTPVWLVSDGAQPLRKLVVAQDTGSAIVGAVRADYFVGSGDEAGELAGRFRQSLRLWALWPR